jgi:proteasome lid subunit RPN8/RPN11
MVSISEHILECYPEEACGILSSGIFYPISNAATDKTTSFVFNANDYINFLSLNLPIDAIVHSHCITSSNRFLQYDARTPSSADYRCQQKQPNIPWHIYSTDGEGVSAEPLILNPNNLSKEILGKQFIPIISDCYSIVREFYFQELGITLQPHNTKYEWEQQNSTQDYLQFFKEYGFYEISEEEAIPGDVVIMSVKNYANHAGILLPQHELLHHMTNRQSEVIPLEKMRSFITFFLRRRSTTNEA